MEKSKMSRAEEAALKAYPAHNGASEQWKKAHLSSLSEYIQGYEQAEKNIISIIESRISEILGDAQPKPVLRAELQELIDRIKEEEE